jgi:tetratricopeptide (TPR) repeat protein
VLALVFSLATIYGVLLADSPQSADTGLPDGEPIAQVHFVERSRAEANRLDALRKFALGVVHERNRRLVDAIDAYEAARELDPDAIAPRKALIPLYLGLDRHTDALALSKQVLEADADDFETWYLLAKQHHHRGELAEAIRAMTRATDCPGLRKLPEAFVHTSMELARWHEEAKDYSAASEILTKAVQGLNMDHPDPQSNDLYEALGQVCAKAGRGDEAIAAYRMARKTVRADDLVSVRRINYELAVVLESQGKHADALHELDQFLQSQPPGTEAYEFKVRLLTQLGRKDEAVRSLQVAAIRDPHNAALKLLLARLLRDSNEMGAAEEVYRTLTAESPSAEVYRGLFGLLAQAKRMPEALRMLDETMAAAADRDDRAGDPGAANRARAMLAVLRDDGEVAAQFLPAVRFHSRQSLQPETRRLLALVASRARQFDLAEELHRSCLEDSAPTAVQAIIYDGLLRALWGAKQT